ncbi:Hypothetical predicted protein [Marmota monax]|uniref:Uncharacterized protein n=1 Tax=Marmota monax TaxID=9995 RepID=A0A5E4B8Z8_MARMO|nr:Hypothetical predicted protein [Marmota monax]
MALASVLEKPLPVNRRGFFGLGGRHYPTRIDAGRPHRVFSALNFTKYLGGETGSSTPSSAGRADSGVAGAGRLGGSACSRPVVRVRFRARRQQGWGLQVDNPTAPFGARTETGLFPRDPGSSNATKDPLESNEDM